MSETGQQPLNRRATDTHDANDGRKGPRIRLLNVCAIVLAAVLALAALGTMGEVQKADTRLEEITDTFTICENAADDLQIASDYLTTQARMYVVTGRSEYLDNYLTELLVTDRRGQAVETLRAYFGESNSIDALQAALDQSNELAERELYAMRLVADATELADMPELVEQVRIDAADNALPVDEKRALAEDMMLNDEYQSYKETISQNVNECSDDLIDALHEERRQGDVHLHNLLVRLQVIVLALLATVVLVIVATVVLILRPLVRYTQRIEQNRPLVLSGANELRYLAGAYNAMYEENHQRTMVLKHAAEHDPLTGLCNRGAYDALLSEHGHDIALLLVDVDKFKEVNDTYGHDVGDAILKRVAGALEHAFRSTDLPCRIGGDEFAVIMTDMRPELRHVVARKVETVAAAVREQQDGLPGVTLSVGIAFSGAHEGEDDIYRAADSALYAVKERGRNGYAFYGED